MCEIFPAYIKCIVGYTTMYSYEKFYINLFSCTVHIASDL